MPGKLKRAVHRFVGSLDGSVAVEMAVLLWPMIALICGILQLAIIQYTQVLLNDALYNSASSPEVELTVPDATAYKNRLCANIRIMSTANCLQKIVVEMNLLSSYGTSKTNIAGGSFTSGVVGDAILLRAALPPTRFVPLLPYWTAKSSVVFRR